MSEQRLPSDDESIGPLTIDYVGESYVVDPQSQLTFGRTADLVIDENPFLHRVAGCFYALLGEWWLRNEGSSIELVIYDVESTARLTVPPGAGVPISFVNWRVGFSAGPTNYAIDGRLPAKALVPGPTAPVPSGPSTVPFGWVPLTADQRLALVALSQMHLRGEPDPIVLPNKDLARQLGWTRKKFERKIDNLAEKFTKAGVPDLYRGPGDQTEGRREKLVRHALRVGMVDAEDLALL